MNAVVRLAVAFAAGAIAMYYLDPNTGRRRRALMRDQGVAARHDLERYARARSKRAVDRLRGAAAKTRARLAHEPVDDDVLRERIRAKLGHLVEHPGTVTVEVREGMAVLGGRAARGEIDRLVEAVSSMTGVEHVDNRLSVNVSRVPVGQSARH